MLRVAQLLLIGMHLVYAQGMPQRGQTATANTGAVLTPGGPFVAVGTGVTNALGTAFGGQAVAAGTNLQGGGGFGFGSNQVTSTAEREGALPIQADSGSTLVSTNQAALGTSQASTLSTQPSNTPGVPSSVFATQAQVSSIAVRGGLTDQQRHIGRIEVGPQGPRATIGDVVERQMTRAGQQATRLGVSARQLQQQAAGFTALTQQAMQQTPRAMPQTVAG